MIVILVIIALVVGLMSYFYFLDGTETNEGPPHVVEDLYVTEISMTYGNGISGGSSVTAYIGIENRGDASQNLDGCKMKASVLYDGVLMDDKETNLDGTLGANNTTTYKVEFSADQPYSSGAEITIKVTIWDGDDKLLDSQNYHFTF